MKTKIVFLLIATIFFVACNQSSQKANDEQVKTEITQNPKLRLQIYYFHATNRCPTCNSIETNVKLVLEENFKNEIEKGIINFVSLNIDEKNNKKLVEKYEIYGSSLHLVQINDGKEKDNDFTDYAFSYSRNKTDYFLKGMQDTINYFINH
ncbi:MAG: nitrophenyl compound nitroreductase subunit ArsF family protein [Bacteroidales bacterium]|nr:nitrophenyl compound nitroreductase subunit ArsF family protein [Bacteroidales bacterium]MDD2387039.1 nitrophenyl compound nitroreductase subunit ArsF family protein [Bacteroidales bacterium]MDD4217693.1 nitrophenyl compound nitroreductase subunit ArsF family protein [Bacteroidales bacterium]MDY0142511.1 nitrophenyl compound nitroreductase subunit ArsF family protein [Bacteroidales bacterium]